VRDTISSALKINHDEMLKLRQLTKVCLISKGATPNILEAIFTRNTDVIDEAIDYFRVHGEAFATEIKIKSDSFAAADFVSRRIKDLLKGESYLLSQMESKEIQLPVSRRLLNKPVLLKILLLI
jgi:hypothetical protein